MLSPFHIFFILAFQSQDELDVGATDSEPLFGIRICSYEEISDWWGDQRTQGPGTSAGVPNTEMILIHIPHSWMASLTYAGPPCDNYIMLSSGLTVNDDCLNPGAFIIAEVLHVDPTELLVRIPLLDHLQMVAHRRSTINIKQEHSCEGIHCPAYGDVLGATYKLQKAAFSTNYVVEHRMVDDSRYSLAVQQAYGTTILPMLVRTGDVRAEVFKSDLKLFDMLRGKQLFKPIYLNPLLEPNYLNQTTRAQQLKYSTHTGHRSHCSRQG